MKGSTSLSENAVTRSARSPRVVASSSEMPTRVGDAMRRLIRRERAGAVRGGSAPDPHPMLRGAEKEKGTTPETERGGGRPSRTARGGEPPAARRQAPSP